MHQELFIYFANTFVGLLAFGVMIVAILSALGRASAQRYIHDDEEHYE